MGASTKTFNRLIYLKQLGLIGVGSRMLELGSQNIHHTTSDVLRTMIAEFRDEPIDVDTTELDGIADGGTMASLMKLCGLHYVAVDLFEAEDCIVFDLNTDRVPEKLRDQFDLVTNLGTTEHVIDQCRCFESMHDFTKPGGVIYHDLPIGGYFYHGYFLYTPLFFEHLAEANNYEVIFRHFSKAPAHTPAEHQTPNEMSECGWPDAGFHDAGIEFILRRTGDHPFRLPVDGGTSRGRSREFLQGKGGNAVIVREVQMPTRRRRSSSRRGRGARPRASC